MRSIVQTLSVIVLISSSIAADTIYFDFGRTDTQVPPGNGWNNVVPATTMLPVTVDSDNNALNIGFEITDEFFQSGEPSSLGSEAPFGDAAGYPVNATDDYFFGHTTPFAGADPNPFGQLKLTNLDPQLTYDFTFFASRQIVTDTRDAEYNVHGGNSLGGVLDASNNDSEVLRLLSIMPDANNEIFIDVMPGPNNDNTNGFFYIGLMQVDFVPEPSSFWLLGMGALALSRRR